jgi:MFS family permease
LSVSVVVLAVAGGAWVWGPVSDRIGRTHAIRLASWLLVAPTIGVALAPHFALLLGFRALQGVCMPGLLIVGAPYVVESLVPAVGQRAMGWYVSSLVAGGLVGRVGVALLSALVGWRWAIGLLGLLPLAAALGMHGTLPLAPAPEAAVTPSAASSTAACSPSPSPVARSSSPSSERSHTSSTGSRTRPSRTARRSRASSSCSGWRERWGRSPAALPSISAGGGSRRR